MDDIIWVIVGFGTFIFFWAFIGHGIWVIASLFLRQIFGKACPQCKQKHFSVNCPNCRETNAALPGRGNSVNDDLVAARRLIRFSKFHQWLDNEQTSELNALIDRLELRVQEDSKKSVDPRQASTPPIELTPFEAPVGTSQQLEQTILVPLSEPHPLDVDQVPSVVAKLKPPVRQRLKADLFKSFMEQSNIRWIELISAALIVVCSVGLVISLWSTLSSTSRFFPSLVFLLATVAVHGAGQYTLRQWKLRSTSRGILHIGLMLIPLAVLIGILLSRRPGSLPVYDAFTILVIAIGTLGYSLLAVTATRALFTRRWLVVAAGTIVSGATLLPIHYLGQHHLLSNGASIWVLAPLALISLWSATVASKMGIRLQTRASSKLRQVSGIVTQSIFSATVAVVFWFLQSKAGGELGEWWWFAAGSLAAAWATWGWTTSLGQSALRSFSSKSSLSSPSTVQKHSEVSWFAVAAWGVASVFTLFLVAAIWQASVSRGPLVCLLLTIAVWWLFSGWLFNLRIGLIAGSLSLLIALTLALEAMVGHSMKLAAIDWLGFQRVAILTAFGCAGSISAFFLFGLKFRNASINLRRIRWLQSPATIETISGCVQISSGIVIAGACLLTIVANLVPFGESAYGGNWASLMLIGYGLLGIVGGLLACHQSESIRMLNAIVPAALVVLLLGTVRICQSSPMLEDFLAEFRPDRAWSIGTAFLGVFGSGLAAALVAFRNRTIVDAESVPNDATMDRRLSWQASNIDSLCIFAALACVPSALAIWTRPDNLELASKLGWFLPITCLSIFCAKRMSWIRELTLVALTLWIASLVIAIGCTRNWWVPLGLAGTTAAIVIVSSFTIAAFEWTLLAISRRPSVRTPASNHWIAAKPQWASSTLLIVAWIAFMLSLLGPAVQHSFVSLGLFSPLDVQSFVFNDLSNTGLGITILAAVILTAISIQIGRVQVKAFLADVAAFLPITIALILSAWISPPYSIAFSLWWLSGLVVASEMLQFISHSWHDVSILAWQPMAAREEKLPRKYRWLPITRSTAIGILLIGTAFFLGSAFVEILPDLLSASSSEWITNVATLFLSVGPMLVVAFIRWALSLSNGERGEMVQASGISTAILGGTLAALALAGGPAWPSTLIVFLQSSAMIAACLAWCTVGLVTGQNFVGLRLASGKDMSTRSLIAASTKGARFRKSLRSSWTINLVSIAGVIGLCVGAAIVDILFPAVRLAGIDRLGSPLVSFTMLLAFSLYWIHSLERGATKFGLLGTTLGLVSPLGAAAYANWLQANILRSYASAKDFEPLRMLIGLWLLALMIGLVVRIISSVKGRKLATLGEAAWIVLATIVGFLALVSTVHDPDPNWPWMELSCLALLAILSSVASQQIWRGHVAAIIAAAGMSVYLRTPNSADWFCQCWNILWGPTWVALVAVLAKLALKHRGPHSTSLSWNLPVEKSVSLSVPIVSACLSSVWVYSQGAFANPSSNQNWCVIGLAIAGVVLAVSRLWEPVSGKRGLAFYANVISFLLVLSAGLCLRYEVPKLQTWLVWMASGMGAMAIIAGLVRELVREASILGPALRLTSIAEPAKIRHAMTWMPSVHTIASFLVLIPSVYLVLAFQERTMRVAATTLPFIGALSILPISRDETKSLFRYCGLTLMSTSLVLLWWADLPSSLAVTNTIDAWIFIHRAFVALVLLGVVYPILANRMRNKPLWIAPLINVGWIAIAIGAILGLVLIVGQSIHVWDLAAADATLGTKWMTIAGWILTSGRLLQFAAKPMRCEQAASVSSRMTAVYLAEIGIALLCGACYFHFPELFHGVFAKWWPLVIFAIAMLSAGIGEWLKRIQQPIVADPIHQSSLLLADHPADRCLVDSTSECNLAVA